MAAARVRAQRAGEPVIVVAPRLGWAWWSGATCSRAACRRDRRGSGGREGSETKPKPKPKQPGCLSAVIVVDQAAGKGAR